MSNLEKIKEVTWPEVFGIWREMEENLEHWQKYWASKGFSSWQAWREKTHENLRGAELSWALYRVANPLSEAPAWRGGLFHSWAKWFYPPFPEQPPRLKDLVAHPGVQNHWYIRELAHKFPKSTTLSAIRNSAGDIVIVEGMHRACALALAAQDTIPVQSDITLALADWPFGDLPRLGIGWK